jgi:hypothetical protein
MNVKPRRMERQTLTKASLDRLLAKHDGIVLVVYAI